MPGGALAQSGTCVLEDSVLICTGDWPDGVMLVVNEDTPPITTLVLNGITSDIDVAGSPGIWMVNQVGGHVKVEAGVPGDMFNVNTAGAFAFGVIAQSDGSPAGYEYLSPLGIWIP